MSGNSKSLISIACLCLSLLAACQASTSHLTGRVIDDQGPVAGARVRVQTSPDYVTTDARGEFSLDDIHWDQEPTITAWAPGYFIAASDPVQAGDGSITIELFRHNDRDYPEYQWVSAFAAAGAEANCENCHSDDSGLLPFEEWLQDAHAQTATNHRFQTMYQGTDSDGRASPPTRYGWNRDYGRFQLPPNPNEPYYGPGYKLDFPETDGNCAACHAPAAAINAPYATDPTSVSGVASEGIGCDFCHKIWDVWLDENSGLPRPNMPGVLSFEFRRPREGHQFFAGPFDDVAPGEDIYSPIQTESAYCAPCHFGQFWDTTIYNSYGEWLDSAYSDPVAGQTCQDCHMPARGATQFATSKAGGLTRNPDRIRSHLMRGLDDQQFMTEALSLQAEAHNLGQEIQVAVAVTNDNTGHKIPTDSPLRNLILLVQAADEKGKPLELVTGPRLPAWAGQNPNEPGHYANQPGRMFALLLRERWTGISPTGAYWNPVEVVSDTRLSPFERDESAYTFQSPAQGPAVIEVQLIFRRAFAQLAEQKGWGLEDRTLQSLTLEIQGRDNH